MTARAVWTAKAKAAFTREREMLALLPTTCFVRADWIDASWIESVSETNAKLVNVRWSSIIGADPLELAASDDHVDFTDVAYSLIDKHDAGAVAPLARWGLSLPSPKVFAALSIVRDSRAVAEFFATCVGRVQDEHVVRSDEFRPTALQYLRDHPALTRVAVAKVAKDEAARARTIDDEEEIARSKAAVRWAKTARF